MNNKITILFIFSLCTFFTNYNSLAQTDSITFTIKEYPVYTPKTAAIYLVTSLNEWAPNDPNFQLKKNGKEYYIRLPKQTESFQYKFTRGNWKSVEGNDVGEIKSNRVYDASSPNEVDIKILSWQDKAKQFLNRVQLIVQDVPEETPYDATLFVTGDFNNWSTNDVESKLNKHPDGNYYITLPIGVQKFNYKITRGSWESVEGRENGRAIENRVYDVNVDGWKKEIKVSSWEDLSGNTMTPYMFLLLLGAFQGIVLILSIFSIQDNNRQANLILMGLIFLTSIALMSRVAMYYRDMFHEFPKVYLVPELLLFLYSPLFYFYIKQLTDSESARKDLFYRFVPFGMQIITYIPLLAMPNEEFINGVLDKEFNWLFNLFGGLGLLFNIYYWWKCKQVLDRQKVNNVEVLSEERNLNYLSGVMAVYAGCLLIWGMLYIVGSAHYLFDYNPQNLIEFLSDTLWFMIASISFVMGYYAMNQPEILRISEVINFPDNIQSAVISSEKVEQEVVKELSSDLIAIKNDLAIKMGEERLYENARLTLPDLAKILETNTHDLSKVINDGYKKNFYDFVNSYRVEAFVDAVNGDVDNELTYLGHAYNVGFNSKTAFNRAFKKETSKTPTQYFSMLKTLTEVSK
ncbi:helix-turn-helix domain-containing protein [Flammeovirga kamogawensis]|uniref:HTH araC/xylS-type domain-containing protein n=1 Tax=Flammeovirga kamogawensis TaxID=373891 RepID=A0ABX8GT68_9BACT|nr:helix-turn-helix domain-containing protein [Flammeovirga kamogawensis]MBB6462469.1 AraC-like DNA-binding protein [Flammeovirga kamogawensis]QWG06793.1 hypothetical protein KM029_16005 [Flammeovirga kamogawensis]TRX68616.1 hypothetical protein EO216_11000 [Flammeovirga kamogawensis]